ncbi:MAG: SLBB domain-containing protein, partial [Thermotogota bacterium]|nr:SLBB domain-containing protein [Thermotogota bacterium]
EFDSLKNMPLEGKVFVEISKIAPDQVIVYKAGETQVIQQKNVRLIDVFSSVNGFSPVDTGTITIYQNNEEIKTINSEDLLSNLMIEVPKGSYVVVQPEVSGSYIAVLGNISPKSLRTDVPMSLVEILSSSVIDWKNQESIFIYTKNNEEIKVDIKDVDSLRNVLVNPGSIVYVPPAEEQVVYVFGEVAKPGIIPYNSGMTVLDAILKAGNASQSAQLTTVYLFKDGPENPPVTLDLSGIIKATPVKTGMNPEVKPKDIIYIPKNTLTNIVEVMSTVQTFMSFINAGFDTYSNVSGLF